MRIRVNRLVYGFVATAFAAGLLVTAFARPEPALTASSTCYGRCTSATTLSFAPATAIFRRENLVVFTIKVHAATGAGTPAGLVTVSWGHVVLCRTTLVKGTAHCSPPPAILQPGKFTIMAQFIGNGTFGPSASEGKTLTVVWN